MLSEKTKPYEFMVYPTLQTAWIKGRGILLFAGLFLVEYGAGLFVAASLLDSLWGQTAGWLISGALGGGCHFLFLGHPFRVYKALRRPGSSWISRGLIIISLFQLSCLIHLILSYFFTPILWVLVVTDILALLTILYGGFEIADVKSISTWHSSFLPFQMLARSFFIGFAVILVGNLLMGIDHPAFRLKSWLLMTLLINIGLFIVGLINLGFEEKEEKPALSMILKGELWKMFWAWVFIGGMIIPFGVFSYSLLFGVEQVGGIPLLIGVLLQAVADPVLRYTLIKSGYYTGIFPGKPVRF